MPQENQLAALTRQGFVLHQQGKFNEARAIYEQVLAIDENYFDVLYLLGSLLAQTKQYIKAVDCLTQASKINPNQATCYYNCGVALKALGRFSEALESYDKAIGIKSDYAEAHSNRGNTLQELKRYGEALSSYDKAISIKTDFAEAYSNRGNVLFKLYRFNEALISHDKAIDIKPDYAEAYSNRGNALQELKRFDEALESYDKAIGIKADYAEAYSNRGNTLKAMGRLDEALDSYDKAIGIKADYASAHWNSSLCHLLGGNFKDGWKGYEWRWKSEDVSKIAGTRNFSQPLWLGAESLKDKTILLYAEQGFGDTIQFCRYAPLVKELGAKVILEVQRPLVKLLMEIEGIHQIIAKGDDLPAFDYQCPLMSLPHAFNTDLHTIPPVLHRITSNSEMVAKWQMKLGEATKRRVGLVWSGSVTHKNDHNRSLSLSQILPYLSENVEYVSLQKEVREIDKKALFEEQTAIQFFGDGLEDFTDTAALCELMDVVVTVDTSVAHLAGTLGKPTWLLLPYSPDWRWLLNGEKSPWYASVRLYRQDRVGDWNSALKRVKHDLDSL
jgi:tetratricopeptide (TPR) repeat protein